LVREASVVELGLLSPQAAAWQLETTCTGTPTNPGFRSHLL